MRPLSLLATGLLAALVLPAPTSYAAGETCQGRPATVVGTAGQYGLIGTEGDDVVVTQGARGVSTLGGNDLVCITSAPPSIASVRLDVGSGDDVVDAAAATGPTSVILGLGRDTYAGSSFDEYVLGGTEGNEYEPSVDDERDVITTVTGGDDEVMSGSWSRFAMPNADVVVLGTDDGAGFGSEVSWFGPMAAGASLDGGGGRLEFHVGSGQALVDARVGTYNEDGRRLLQWSGFDRFTIGGGPGPAPSSLTFVGADRAEQLSLDLANAHTTREQIDMAGGDDTLSLEYGDSVGARGSTYEGGSGQDHVDAWAGSHLDLDLSSGRMETRAAGRTIRTRLTGFETQLLGADTLELDGTSGADVIRFFACTATVRGNGGADDMAQARHRYTARPLCHTTFRLFGGRGDDTLRGSADGDLLVGGRGRDRIDGNAGRDRCSGEKLKSCEVRLR